MAVVASSGSSAGALATAPRVALGPVQIVPALALRVGRRMTVADGPVTAAGAAVSFDVALTRGGWLTVQLGPAGFAMRTDHAGAVTVLIDHRSRPLTLRSGWLPGPSLHVEAAGGRVEIDGQRFVLPIAHTAAPAPAPLAFDVVRGTASLSAVLVSSTRHPASLLLHRLAELHARVPVGKFPVGADVNDRLYVRGAARWTSGFWAGALWQAAALEPAGGMFASWALAATLDHFGEERKATHDVGFMYGQSSLAAWEALCRRPSAPAAVCDQLRQSVLAAAGELLALAATNPGSGTIPTNATSTPGDSIVDSLMNIAILPFATRVSRDPRFAQLASHQAHVLASKLVRRDGSTAQAVNFNRRTGRVMSVGTHQGISRTSTWSRGQGWAVYGFSQAAGDLNDRSLLGVAQRTARYVGRHLPPDLVPLWDYDAPPGSAIDTSAGVITAAGLLHLVHACNVFAGACADPGQWTGLARAMLGGALEHVSTAPPLGMLTGQESDSHYGRCWCNGGELIYGLTYALEALRLQR